MNVAKVKPLVWHNFDAWTHWAEAVCGTYHVEERNGYWQVELRVGGLVHHVTTTDDTLPEDLDAAKAVAQQDYDPRILCELATAQPAPDAPALDVDAVATLVDAVAADAAQALQGEDEPYIITLISEFVWAVWNLMDNSETTTGTDGEDIITVWGPNFKDVGHLLDKIEGLPSGNTEMLSASDLTRAALTALSAERDALAAQVAVLTAANTSYQKALQRAGVDGSRGSAK